MGKTNILVHVVWATHRRLPLIQAGMDPWLAQFLHREAEDVGAELLAAGNAEEHVHVVVRVPGTVSLAEVVQRLKGGSSSASKLEFLDAHITWQESYWAESCSPTVLAALVEYVINQRAHHGQHSVQHAWEPPEEH